MNMIMDKSEEVNHYMSCLSGGQLGGGGNTSWGGRRPGHSHPLVAPQYIRVLPGQRGFGLGNFVGTVKNFILPILQKYKKKAIRSAIAGGAEVLFRRRKPEQVFKRRATGLLREVAGDIIGAAPGPPPKKQKKLTELGIVATPRRRDGRHRGKHTGKR